MVAYCPESCYMALATISAIDTRERIRLQLDLSLHDARVDVLVTERERSGHALFGKKDWNSSWMLV